MDVREFYENLLGRDLPAPQSGENPNVSTNCFCGGHENEDEHESCSVNLANGLWFCHVTNTGGNMVGAYQKIKGVSRDEAKKAVREMGVKGSEAVAAHADDLSDPKVIDQEIAEIFQRSLVQDKDVRTRAIKEFGWSPDTMRRYCIGYSAQTKRYTFPVYDDQGRLVNIRMYNPDSRGKDKMINWTDSSHAKYGAARLWPIDSLRARTIILCEGEKDCTLMNQILSTNQVDDWAAITGTGGAGTWKDTWNESFRNKRVVIIYDRDKAGQENSQSIAAKLFHTAMEVQVVTLDISEPVDADITDYFVSSSKGWDDLKALIDSTDVFTVQTKRHRVVGERDTTVYKPHLSQASDKQYINKILEIKAMVSGKDLAPFAVPAKVVFDCEMDAGERMCAGCAMKNSGGLIEMTLKKDDPDLINLIKVPDSVRDTHVRARRGINTRCQRVDMEIVENHNIEEVTLVPEIDFADVEREYVSRTAYVVEHGVIANRSYVLSGTAVPHPKTQHVTHFVPKIQEAQDSIDDFKMDEDKLKILRVFQPADGQSVREKFEEIAHDLSFNITKIYGRDDLIHAVDLCYHTVLAFNFQGKAVAKAWGDVLIVGDTGTGKTETVQEIIRHYRLGELSVGESMSFAGLVGGLKQESGKRWSITWGRIPLNDRRLLVIDEASGLGVEDIGAMSGIRSSGIAEITKIVTQKTMARTRLIWISNPRSNRSMSQYGHGVEVVKDLIGRPEDIRRFDFVVAAATNEVPIEVINARRHETVDHRYTSDLCRMLVLWAWSRKAADVHFTEGATRKILEFATEHSSKYASQGGVPLVEGGNQRIKLAKLAVAAACRVFSTRDGVRLDVKSEHVEFASEFLDRMYAKESLDYAGWSATILNKVNVPGHLVDQAREWIRDHAEWSTLWIEANFLRIDDFKTQFDLETADVKKEITAPLSRMRMIERGPASTFKKTPAFIKLLKEERETVETAPVPAGPDDIPF